MLITAIEAAKNNRYRIFGEDQFLFALYGKELKRYHIEEGTEIPETTILTIIHEVIYKRAKERALFLLERRPLTTFMLKTKLKENDYPLEVINQVVSFLETYHYLDDGNYIQMYIRTYGRKKSKRQLIYDLQQKGISRPLLDAYFEVNDYSEQSGFEYQFRRYIRRRDVGDPRERQRIFRYFYSKGFSVSMIESALRNELEDC
ncbi:MAG: recombination regulator RecX [Clostridium sp.]|nr:recombination regulator RecX [Clostridium sp.]